MQRRRLVWFLSLLLSMSLVAAACGDDDDDEGAGDTTEEEAPRGGTVVVGAEQEPDCVDWVAPCAAASWGFWTMAVTTIPRVFAVQREGDSWGWVTTDLVTEEPELETEPQQRVTYRINPDANWSDGTPITSADFKYVWEEVTTGTGIYDTTGYANIESVDDSDPKTAVVTFREPFANWRSLFAGNYGILPAHILRGQDREAIMANGYDFSGGPWKIQSWEKGTSATLVPNENYWGEKPRLDRLVYRFITDTAAEFQAFQNNETQVIYPQPQLDVVDQVNAGLDNAESDITPDTGNLEALWFNNSVPPFDNVAFRRAFAYALDRGAIVERLFGDLDVTEPMNTMNAPILERFADTDAWADYERDLDQVDEIMTGDGWQKGSDGIWAKGGQRATFVMKSTSGNQRRELTEQIVQQQAREAGFDMQINNQAAGDLFGQQLPQGDFQVALYASVLTTLHPTSCVNFCSKNTPTAENEFSGNNYPRVNNPEIDRLGNIVDTALDEDEVIDAVQQIDRIMAEDNNILPLDPLPNLLLWSNRVVGPLEANPIMGPFYNAHLWGIRR